MAKKMILRRMNNSLPELVSMVRESKLENRVFLCRKGPAIFTSMLYFAKAEDLLKGEEPNIPGIGMLFFVTEKVRLPVGDADEVNLILLKD
jgi:hypothetical protein